MTARDLSLVRASGMVSCLNSVGTRAFVWVLGWSWSRFIVQASESSSHDATLFKDGIEHRARDAGAVAEQIGVSFEFGNEHV